MLRERDELLTGLKFTETVLGQRRNRRRQIGWGAKGCDIAGEIVEGACRRVNTYDMDRREGIGRYGFIKEFH